MAKQDQILDEGLVKKKPAQPKTSFKTDLGNMLIGIVVIIAFITGIVFLIGLLLN